MCSLCCDNISKSTWIILVCNKLWGGFRNTHTWSSENAYTKAKSYYTVYCCHTDSICVRYPSSVLTRRKQDILSVYSPPCCTKLSLTNTNKYAKLVNKTCCIYSANASKRSVKIFFKMSHFYKYLIHCDCCFVISMLYQHLQVILCVRQFF